MIKIFEIAKLCKKNNHITLINTNNGQWVGVDSAVYYLHGFPKMDEDQIRRMLDVPVNELGNFKTQVNVRNYLEDGDLSEEFAKVIIDNTASLHGYVELEINKNTEFIDETYLNPLGGIAKSDQYSFFNRVFKGNPEGIIIVKDGIIPVAAICKNICVSEETVEKFKKFTQKLENALKLQKARENLKKHPSLCSGELQGQTSIE